MNLPCVFAVILQLGLLSINSSPQELLDSSHAAAAAAAAAMSIPTRPSLAIATRLHLGHASHPPPPHQLHTTLTNFANLARKVHANIAIVSVDAEERIEGYSLVSEVETICREMNHASINADECRIEVIPIQPWGKFVPALNVIVAHSARKNMQCLLLVSAEVGIRGDVMEDLWREMNLDDTLVVGPALQGHKHQSPTKPNTPNQIQLSGRTCPWNTFALWNVPKLSLTGFLQISEGLHGDESTAGIEEVCTVATIQKLQPEKSHAKLIKIQSPKEVVWGQDFSDDRARMEWHERKMQSKDSRAKAQLDLIGLSGTVLHG